MGKCRLCLERPASGKSHIVPEAFHRYMLADSAGPSGARMVGLGPDEHPKRLPIGAYDEDLLCPSCEIRFGPWDAYGAQCLIQNFERDARVHLYPNGTPHFYEAAAWDESRLRMFAVSILWRAAATSHAYYAQVDIGPHEERLRSLTLAGDPGSPDDFSVTLGHWYSNFSDNEWTRGVLSPLRGKLDGVNVVWLFFSGGWVCIKCDQRMVSRKHAGAILYTGRPVRIAAHPFDDSPILFKLNDAYRKAKKLPKLF